MILRKTSALIAMIGALAFALSSCAQQETRINLAPGEKFKISQGSFDFYQRDYLPKVTPSNPGAFAVSEDGHGSYYSYCPGMQCIGAPNYSNEALKMCERDHVKCVIFARSTEIVIPYEIIP